MVFSNSDIRKFYSNWFCRPLCLWTGFVFRSPSLKADLVFQGLQNPTSMVFLGPNDILVLEKDQGTLQRIVNGNMLPHPVLHVNVATEGERGILGIAIAKPTTTANGTTARFVFLYYTESGAHLGNHVYRYELVDNKLVNPKLES